jgi:hypothetical protein
MCDIYASRVMTNSQLMDYMVSLHFIDFISWGVLDSGPLYCITLCPMAGGYYSGGGSPSNYCNLTLICCHSCKNHLTNIANQELQIQELQKL